MERVRCVDSSRPKAHRHEEECTEELVGECDTVKDLRCKRVKEEEYEDLDFEECDDKEESTPTEFELEYTTGIKALSMP